MTPPSKPTLAECVEQARVLTQRGNVHAMTHHDYVALARLIEVAERVSKEEDGCISTNAKGLMLVSYTDYRAGWANALAWARGDHD